MPLSSKSIYDVISFYIGIMTMVPGGNDITRGVYYIADKVEGGYFCQNTK